MLTNAQVQVLRTAIDAEADSTFVGYRTNGQTGLMAEWFNGPSTFVVWKTHLSADDLRSSALTGAAEMDNLETGKRDALFWMLAGSVNPALTETRQAFLDLTANRTGGFVASALRAALTVASKRAATRAEKLYATGTGTNGTPGGLVFEGAVSDMDISAALAL